MKMADDETQMLCAGIQSQLSRIRCPRLTSAVRNYFGAWPWQVRGTARRRTKGFLFCPCLLPSQSRANVVFIQEYKCHLQSHSGEEGGEQKS